MNEEVIFDLTHENWQYKGVLFAEVDNKEMDKSWPGSPSIPQKFAAGVLAIVYVDDKGIWHYKGRLKFPQSGNKQVFSKSYEKQQQQGAKINETYALNDIYCAMPMIHKTWTPNPSGEGWGIVEIMEKLDMIESSKIVRMDAKD